MTLSDKIGKDRGIFNDVDVLRVLDVKEFIKELNKELDNLFSNKINAFELQARIDKLAGDKLNGV
tara:strand:+ start:108 stop:302 length:195 start_codon:yes stop_codon:yes gene_type:complete